jgi:hypothetical protein
LHPIPTLFFTGKSLQEILPDQGVFWDTLAWYFLGLNRIFTPYFVHSMNATGECSKKSDQNECP